eukprot:Em0008g557a
MGRSAVATVCYLIREWADHGVEQHWFSNVDFDPPSIPNIWAGLKVIDLLKKRKESIYVHCKAGMGRSL